MPQAHAPTLSLQFSCAFSTAVFCARSTFFARGWWLQCWIFPLVCLHMFAYINTSITGCPWVWPSATQCFSVFNGFYPGVMSLAWNPRELNMIFAKSELEWKFVGKRPHDTKSDVLRIGFAYSPYSGCFQCSSISRIQSNEIFNAWYTSRWTRGRSSEMSIYSKTPI